MGAKSKTPTKNAKKAAVELKSPKTPKADKVATKAKKLETKDGANLIQTVRGVGYQMTAPQ